MPKQPAGKPAAKSDAAGKPETEQRRRIVNLPSRHDHQDHRHRVDPVHDPDPRRLHDFRRHCWGLGTGCKARHGNSVAEGRINIHYTPGTGASLQECTPSDRWTAVSAVTKKRAGLPQLALRIRCGRSSVWRYDGIRTVSTTWITPFDWLTFGIVTVDESPLASMIITLSPDRFTVRSSPSTVLSFLPSVRAEASSLPGTTW